MGVIAPSDVPLNASPGTYIQFNPKGQQPGATDRRLTGRYCMNLIASMDSDAAASTQPGVPVLCNGESDAITKFGKRSGARRLVSRVLAAVPAGLDVFVTPIRMSGGTAAVFNLNVVGLSGATAASGSGQIRVYGCDHEAVVDVRSGDTLATIATNLRAAMVAQWTPATGPGKPVPFSVGNVTGSTQIPLTWTVAGVHGIISPIWVQVDPSITGIGISLGTSADGSIKFAGGPTGGAAGVVTLAANTKTVSATGIAINTSKEDVCAALVAAVNADTTGFPFTAQQRGAGSEHIMDLIFKSGRVGYRLTLTLNADIANVTATVPARTLGAGTPSLSAVLSNLAQAEAFAEWVTEFSDATSLGLIATHVRTQGNGENQKEQFLTWGDDTGLTAAGAAVAAVSPSLLYEDNLQASPGRFLQVWTPDHAQPASELAAMRAAIRCSQQRPTRNLNGWPIVSKNPAVPLTLPDVAVRPDSSTAGQARKTYFMTPLIVKNGTLVIEADTSTYGGSLSGWSTSEYAHGAANFRQECLADLQTLQGTESVVNSQPLTPEVIDGESIKDRVYKTMVRLEKQNLFDGADLAKSQISVQRHPTLPEWWLVAAPFILPRRVDVIAGQAFPAG